MAYLRSRQQHVARAVMLVLMSFAPFGRAQGTDGQGKLPASFEAELLEAGHLADPLVLARVLDRHGDLTLRAALLPRAPAALRLAAVRAAPFGRDPSALLMTLCELLGGRDPDLAPASGAALDAIAERLLDPRNRERLEVTEAALLPVGGCLERVWKDESARADLRATALRAQAQLGLLARKAQP